MRGALGHYFKAALLSASPLMVSPTAMKWPGHHLLHDAFCASALSLPESSHEHKVVV